MAKGLTRLVEAEVEKIQTLGVQKPMQSLSLTNIDLSASQNAVKPAAKKKVAKRPKAIKEEKQTPVQNAFSELERIKKKVSAKTTTIDLNLPSSNLSVNHRPSVGLFKSYKASPVKTLRTPKLSHNSDLSSSFGVSAVIESSQMFEAPKKPQQTCSLPYFEKVEQVVVQECSPSVDNNVKKKRRSKVERSKQNSVL